MSMNVRVKKIARNTVLVAGSAFASASAFAVTPTVTESITAAVDAAKANMTLVTVGVLTVAALGFGIGMVTGFLRR